MRSEVSRNRAAARQSSKRIMLVVKSFRGYFGEGVGADVEPRLIEIAEDGVESRFVLFPDTLTAQLDGGDDSSDCVELLNGES
jgi:hypothetical protein